MNNIANISLVGAGNVAFHLGHALEAAGMRILEIHARKEASAMALIEVLASDASYKKDLDFSDSKAELIILCVSDDAIGAVAKKLKVPTATTVVHTSGAVEMGILEAPPSISSCGVLYPLQTFSRDRNIDFSEVPILIESSGFTTRSRLLALASQISHQVRYVSSDDRKRIHLAAVFANNFTNHLLKLSFDQLSELDVDKALLRPLVMETVLKTFEDDPEASQTGPARRGDKKSITAHIELLSDHPDAQVLYKLISNQIKSHFSK
ncbi:MAG: DUF2520 domain-containing protein [Cyclobacteriaceae bacterium]